MPDNRNNKPSRNDAAALRRQLIVHSAIECFAVKGFHQTSIRDIAQKAEISLGNLYNYFASKEDLIIEIAKVEAEDIVKYERILRSEKDPVRAIEKFVGDYLKETSQPFYAALAIDIAAESMRNRVVAKHFLDNRTRLLQALESALLAGVESRSIDRTIDCEGVASLILDAIEGVGFRSAMQGRRVNSKSRKALLMNIGKLIGSTGG